MPGFKKKRGKEKETVADHQLNKERCPNLSSSRSVQYLCAGRISVSREGNAESRSSREKLCGKPAIEFEFQIARSKGENDNI